MTTVLQRLGITQLREKRLIGLAAVAAGLMLQTPTQALTINLTDIGDTPMTAQQMAAFEEAAQIWENNFTDPITVNLNVAWDDGDTFSSVNVLAATTTARATFNESTVRACLLADSSGAAETGADTQLPTPDAPVIDINGARDDDKVTMAFANAKALGVTPALDPTYGDALENNADGQVRYNADRVTEFDLDRSDGISPSQFDFIGVAAHEIGHALGFFSVTDVQDGNPTFTLHPNTLDLWRFDETGVVADVTNDDRIVTAGDAEYSDTVLNNIPFSRGVAVTDPMCDGAGGVCQASHWQDDQQNLMDPTVDTGVLVNPTGDDLHALDYIGYDRRFFWILPRWRWLEFRLEFFDPVCLRCPIDLSRGPFRDFAVPNFDAIKAPFEGANIAFYAGLSAKQESLDARSAIGVARFERAQKNRRPTTLASVTEEVGKQWEVEELALEPLKVIPARLMNFYFESDSQAGVPFRFTGVFSDNGSSFDPSLGNYGGFRVSGVIDTDVDDVRGDIDATTTMVLLLQDKVDVSEKGLSGLSFSIDWPDGRIPEDNTTTIIDYRAFKLPAPDRDRDKVADIRDNCPAKYNPKQIDSDGDGTGDACERRPVLRTKWPSTDVDWQPVLKRSALRKPF